MAGQPPERTPADLRTDIQEADLTNGLDAAGLVLPPIGSHEDNPFAPKRPIAIVCYHCGLRYDGDAPQFCAGCGAGL